MVSLNTTLLREKFIIREANTSAGRSSPLIALGNRIALPLQQGSANIDHTLIVRGQNMHSTLRMAALLWQEFHHNGPFASKANTAFYANIWKKSQTAFERQHNKDGWIALYHEGRCIYSSGLHHPFFDVIELCDAKNRDEYDRAVTLAEDTFHKTGKAVKIDHHTNIAAVIGTTNQRIRFGLIARKPGRTATFNFSAETNKERPIFTENDVSPSLQHAANWLELIQLCVTAGFYKSKRGDALLRSAPLPAVHARLGELNSEIKLYEGLYHCHYRPERPNMMTLIDDTAFFARHGRLPH